MSLKQYSFVLVIASGLAGAACASSSSGGGTSGGAAPGTAPGTATTGGDAGAIDPGVAAPTDGGATRGGDMNPYGKAYPTDKIGTNPRKGQVPGDRIANLKFMGFPDGDTTKPIQPVSLADFFDPEVKKYKLIRLSAASRWCTPCKDETKETGTISQEYLGKKVVFVQALIDSTSPGTPATEADAKAWATQLGINFTLMLDPELKNLGIFFKADAIPWNASIDARSMELLAASSGYSGSVRSDVDAVLTRFPTKSMDEP